MNVQYYDLKPGESLAILQRGIVLSLKRVQRDGSAMAEIRSRHHYGPRMIRPGWYMRLDERTGLYSYGNRHHGRRLHVRIDQDGEYPGTIQKLGAFQAAAALG